MLYFIAIAILFIPICILYPTKVVGKRNIPKKGGVILCGNHQSNVDVLLFATRFRTQKFLAKKELAKNFFLKILLKAMRCIFVDRKKPGVEAYKKVCAHLNKGGAMTIFPEGTRKITTEESLAMKNGVAMFALKTSSPIVPIAIIKKPRLFRRNVIIVGKPFYFEKVDKITKEVLNENSKILSDKILELRNSYLLQQKNKKNKKNKRKKA